MSEMHQSMARSKATLVHCPLIRFMSNNIVFHSMIQPIIPIRVAPITLCLYIHTRFLLSLSNETIIYHLLIFRYTYPMELYVINSLLQLIAGA